MQKERNIEFHQQVHITKTLTGLLTLSVMKVKRIDLLVLVL